MYEFNNTHANPQEQKLIYEFGRGMKFNIKQEGRKSDGDKTLIKLVKSASIIVSASGVSSQKTIFLPSDPNELCDRIKLLLQEKQAGNSFDIINEEIAVILDKILNYKCISTKQHKQMLSKCNLLHK